ncbi:MAG: low temperature requirement protein A [Acidimicrobiia bacterium]
MRNVVLPDRTEDFTADTSELYFDLAFVFGFSQLVALLINEHDWAGVGKATLLFVLIWMVWSQFTWTANAVPGNQPVVRLFFMVSTAVTIPMSASVSTAFGGGGPVFAIALSLIFMAALGLTVYSVKNLVSEPAILKSLIRYGSVATLSLVPLVVGAFFDGATRVVLWLVSVALILTAMAISGGGEFLVRSGHFAERHGLIMIVALGEVIVAVGIPVVRTLEDSEKSLDSPTVVALVASGAFAGLLWWLYFDRLVGALEHRVESLQEPKRSTMARDLYTAGHIPVVGGVILAAAALEEIALHPEDPVGTTFGLMLFAGVSLFLVGVTAVVFRGYSAWAVERLGGAVLIGAVLAFGADLQGVVVLVLIDLVLLGVILLESRRLPDREG